MKKVLEMIFRYVLAFCIMATPTFANTPLQRVTLQLSWFDQFQFAGYYIAKEKGFYKEAGLDVTILPFHFGINIPELISTEKVDFAIGRETLIIERAKEKKLVALYALFQTSPLVLLAKKDSQIQTIDNVATKRIMATLNDASEASLQAMISSRKLSPNDYHFLKHTHDVSDLIHNKTDLMSAYISKAPYELEKMGVAYTIFNPKDYGFDMYSDFLYTSESLIYRDIKMVEAFKRASLKGWKYAYDNIEECADTIFHKYNIQKLTKDALIYEGNELKKLSFFGTNVIGTIEKHKLQRIYDLYNVMGFMPQKIDINEFIFHNFGFLTEIEKKYLHTKGMLRVCADPDWMPFEKIENGKLIGMSGEYLKILESRLGIPIQLLNTTSWKESIDALKKRECDFVPLSMPTAERSDYMYFTTPYLSVPLVIATTMDKFFVNHLDEIKADQPIGVVKGYAFGEFLKKEYPHVHFVEVVNIKEGLKKVSNGQLFGFVDTLITIGYELQKDYIGTLKIAGKLDEIWKLSFGTRNDEPLLLHILEKFVTNLDEKTKQDIETQWVNITYEKEFDYTLFWKLFIALVIIFVAISLRFRTINQYNEKINKNLEIIDEYVLVAYTDKNGIITYVSQALCRMTQYTKEELIGKPHSIFRHPEIEPKTKEEILNAFKEGVVWGGEVKTLKKDGSFSWVDARISPMFDKQGNVEGFSSFQYDITDKKRIEELSHTDQLTQIPNRLFLDTFYTKEFQRAQRYGSKFSLILADVDFFKTVNDSFGHHIGDDVLVEIAKLLKSSIRSSDIIGRWGGEEFLIICPNTTSSEASLLAEKMRVKIKAHSFTLVGQKTCSFGISELKIDDQEEDVFQRADTALYQAKQNGRNSIVIS